MPRGLTHGKKGPRVILAVNPKIAVVEILAEKTLIAGGPFAVQRGAFVQRNAAGHAKESDARAQSMSEDESEAYAGEKGTCHLCPPRDNLTVSVPGASCVEEAQLIECRRRHAQRVIETVSPSPAEQRTLVRYEYVMPEGKEAERVRAGYLA
jgi:hypothetical protein